MKRVALASQFRRGMSTFGRIRTILGEPRQHDDSRRVQLRGLHLRGNFDDLPNMIFFPEACDKVENWVKFFTNSKILDYRNVWLLHPRNFGSSDRHPSFDLSDMADDVVRFMYEQQISTATLGGHGFGGKVALATGCYHAERVTGVVGVDSAPLDHRYYDAYKDFKGYIEKIKHIEMKRPRITIEADIRRAIEDPKWRDIFIENLKRVGEQNYDWSFDLANLHRNVSFNKADSIGYWAEKHGLYTGRVCFLFPEYSRWIHLNTNTLPIMKVCMKAKGYGHDILAIQGDENPLNHWVYEFDQIATPIQSKMTQFLRMYDGVHTLLQDRSEIGNFFIPDRINSRSKSDHVYSDYSPAHLHHNWRFSGVYDKKKVAGEETKDK